MTSVTSDDLRNHTADVLRKVADGEVVTITEHGEAVAEIRPVINLRRRWLTRADLAVVLASVADPGLRADLADLDQSTEELPVLA